VAQRPVSSSSRSALIARTPRKQNFKATCPPTIKLRGSCGPGSSSLAWPGHGQLLQASPPTGLVVGEQRRRGDRKVKSSRGKAEFERKETQQDGKTTVEYSCVCLHCQRTLMSDHWAERNAAQEPPAQSWHLQVPVQPLCTTGGKAGA